MNQTQGAHPAGLGPGERIGKYEVLGPLAAGDRATVYRCHDPLLDRDVAVKHIPAPLAQDPAFLERFRREARVLARLGAQQPAIIAIHELLEEDRGLFVVMEMFPGRPLESMLAEGPGPSDPKAALQIVWRVAAGLKAVHEAGIVHGNLAPSNILIGEGLRVKITDFGMGLGGASAGGATPYAAPELLEGRPIDGRTDQYSLGMIAYEMFLGRARFNEAFADVIGDGQDAANRWDAWHTNDQVHAPRLGQVLPHLPAALSQVVATMMAKYPQERFEDMEHLGRAIRLAFSPKRPAAAQAMPTPAELAEGEETLVIGHRFGAPAEAEGQAPWTLTPRPLEAPPGLSTRAKVALSVTAAAVVLVAGLGLLVATAIQHQRRLARAQEQYQAAEQLYQQGQYEQAAAGMDWVGHEFAGADPAAKAAVMSDLARAAKAIRQEQWQVAADRLDGAKGRLDAMSARRGELMEWATTARPLAQALADQLAQARAFAEAIEQARAALAAGEPAVARRILQDQLAAMELTADQREPLDGLRRELDIADFRGDFAAVLAQADQRMQEDNFAAAQEALALLQSLLGSTRVLPLATPDRQAIQEQLLAAQQRLAVEQQLPALLQQAAQAAQAGDVPAELTALQKAQEFSTDPQRAARILQLRAQVAMRVAQEHRQRGDLEQAQAVLRGVLGDSASQTQPDDPPALTEARRAMQRIQGLIRRADLMRSAEAKLAAGQLAGAVADLEAAQRVVDDEEVQGRLRMARYRLEIRHADELASQRQYDQAIDAYQKARQISPESPSDVDARIAQMSRQREYQALLDQGRAAIDQQEWDEAVRLLNLAKSLVDDPEVNQLLSGARYRQNVNLGRRAISRRDYSAARGYLNLAKRINDTQEVNQLLEEVAKAATQPQ
jgi:serine/threonine-protein kinase